MNKKEIFINYIKEYLETPLEKFYQRKKKINFLEKVRKIYVLIWPRRAWKTYYCYQIIDELLKKWINKNQTLYVYLENDEFYPIDTKDLNLLLETYFEIVWYDKNKRYYIFLDEIQEVENWQKFALKVYKNFKNIELILTWSTSKLLSAEIASWLRWKALSYEILPLDFDEVLIFKWFEKKYYYSKTDFLKLKNIFNEILIYWMFPEVVLEENLWNKLNILQDYSELIFYKDIIERFWFKNTKKLRWFKRLLIGYMWNFINYSKFAKDLGVEYNTILSWLEGFQSVFLIFELKNFDLSLKRQVKSFSKVYVLDNGFYTLNFKHYKQDFGKYFENFVFLEFRKRKLKENENIFYFKNKDFDIDFLIFEDEAYFVNVVYSLTEENFEREVKKLAEASKKYNIKWKVIYYENLTRYDSFEDIEFVRFDKM